MTPDVIDFTSPDAPARFTESLRTTGFAVITNHPLSWELVQSLYAEWDEFFVSGAADAYTVGPDNQEGYFPPKIAETAKGQTIRDLKEFFHVYPWSDKYPTEVSDDAMKYRDIATDVASTLLQWVDANIPDEVAEGLSRPVAEMLTGNSRTLLRILRYPPLEGDAPEGAVRAAAHEDINLLTVLPASNETGLELLGTDGEWYAVPCDPGSIAVNCGEMLDLATNGYLPATTHRVVNPIGEAAQRARMSMPLFLAAADDVVITNGRTASELLAERIAELRSQDPAD
jgi:isopenicillin N synthase-like dioxygenase